MTRRLFRDLTLRWKLTAIGALSSLTALAVVSISLLTYDSYSLKQRMVRRLRIEAQIVSINSVSPVLFDDPEAATTTLVALKAEPTILGALILGRKGDQPLASYQRSGGPSVGSLLRPREGEEGATFAEGSLFVWEPIRFEERVIGSVVIRAGLQEIQDQHLRYVGLMVAILLGSFALAAVISRAFEKSISRPLLRLAETAADVSNRGDYSVRAVAEGHDEIGGLIGTFNGMLDHIQAQNAALEESNAQLERRVESRTQELAAANRELEAFSYSVSHDLRAPLRAIDGFSKALIDSHKGLEDKGRHYLDRIRAGTRRMSELIDDLLGLAKVSRKELVRQTVDVGGLASQVAVELARRTPDRQAQVEIADGLIAEADPQLLKIVLENLMGNAWKFTAKTPDARIEVGRRSESGALYVRDNGAGFDMAYADKLFGAFQRLHSESEFEGTGIGLVTVQRIVNRHGGRVWAEGEVGKGATFHFTLEPES